MHSSCKTTQKKKEKRKKNKEKTKQNKTKQKKTDSEAQEKRGTNQIRYFIKLFLHSIKYLKLLFH